MTDFEKIMLTVAATLAASLISGIWAFVVSRHTARSNLTLEQVRAMYRGEIDERLHELRVASDHKLEALKYDLSRQALVHEIKFRKLYDRVSDVVQELFRLVTRAYVTGGVFVSPLDWDTIPKEEKGRVFGEEFNALVSFIRDNRIFLPKQLHNVVNRFMDPLRDTGQEFMWALRDEVKGKDTIESWTKANAAFKNTIMPLYEALCREMQTFIGLD
jgi:hypothetical protein